MQISKGHLIIILAVGLILLNFLINLRAKPAGRVIKSDIIGASDMQTIKEENRLVSTTAGSSLGITILGIRSVDNVSVTQNKSAESLVKEKAATIAASAKKSGAFVFSKSSQDESHLAPAGITVLGKEPPQKKKEEMNAKGIVLY